MKPFWKLVGMAAILWAGRGYAVVSASLEDSAYAVILERQPFGDLDAQAAEGTATPPPAPPGPSFVQNIQMCAITESQAGVRVGFVDTKAKPPRSYFLYIGEAQDGIQLLEADYHAEKALLRKGNEQEWIQMDGIAAVSTAPESAKSGKAPARTMVSRTSSSSPSRPTPQSYAERLRQRREALRKRQEASQQANKAMTAEEVRKQLQEYQMDLIRKGKTPLPIPLTPEMDAKLVKEGVLPEAVEE